MTMEKLKELAMNGGTPAAAGLPPRGHMGKEEKAAVDALFDEMIASGNAPTYHGKQEEAFCKEFAEYLGGGYADGVNSGTNSVFVALRALDLPPFSEVLFGCITDNGGVMPIVMNNCIPIPVDTVPGSFNIGPEQIEARITERTSAIVIAHIMGEPADMPAIMKVYGYLDSIASLEEHFEQFLTMLKILNELSLDPDARTLASSSFTHRDDARESRRVAKVKDYISVHYAEPLRLEDLASLVGMAPSAFSRFFKQHANRTLVDFIIDTRLGNAARMLVDTSASISEICYACGFNNLSNFNRMFKTRRGYTPRDFRTLFTKNRVFV